MDRWAELSASTAIVGDDPGLGFLPTGGVAVVRPDRYVGAVATDAGELRQVTTELLTWFAPPA